MPLKRAIVKILSDLETSLDAMERVYAADPSPILHGVLVRRRRAALVLRNRLSRKDRIRSSRPAASLKLALPDLIQMESTLLALFDDALHVAGIDPELATILRNLRSEVEQARYSLAAVQRSKTVG